MKLAGLAVTLGELGIGGGDLEFIADEAFTPSRMGNNPRELERDDVLAIVKEIL